MGNNNEKRLRRLRKAMRAASVPALLVTKPVNVRYLTGFTGEDSYLLVSRTDTIMLTDGRFITQLEQECPGLELEVRVQGETMSDLVPRIVKRCKLGRIACEGDSMSIAQFAALTDNLPDVSLEPAPVAFVEQLREIKDRDEIAEIRRAVSYAQRAFMVIRAQWRQSQTERLVAAEIEHQIRLFGGEGCSFPPIVAVGERAALPHARATDVEIGAADFTLIDWGAVAGGYASDLTRVLVTGRISPKLERVYGVVLTAQQRAIEAIRPGVTMSDVDAVARTFIADAGLGKHFGHGLGHGIGLEIHEAPRLSVGSQRKLEPGMVVTVEPGVYLPGWGGVRIEDDVLVTTTGFEVLSDLPRELESCVVDA
ncbi:MAG: aminopeptidase P family protein [Planctomycetales bacterium]|nr:aminopeptidase P family protein [Planctomycetales bacterium]